MELEDSGLQLEWSGKVKKKKKVKTRLNLKESVGIEVERIDNTVTKGSSMYRERPVYKLVGVVENELSLGGKGCLENKCFN